MFWSSVGFYTNTDMETLSHRSAGWVSNIGFLLAEYFLGGWSSKGVPTSPLAHGVLRAQKKVSGGKTN
ncbi:MAG: hypothetical protein KatS3mg087_1758 [Patescibacteria group bacterium]|nr:MAG: hypothetical protein KatS3mg087_1758 [Patescibacteria group bacterium]